MSNEIVTLEDCELPKSVLHKIIKRSLPETFSIAKDSKTVLAKATAVFIAHLTAGKSN
jgi:histone H3/H4